MQWLHAANVIVVKDIKSLNKRVLQCWLIGLFFAIALQVHKLRINAAQLNKAIKKDGDHAAIKAATRCAPIAIAHSILTHAFFLFLSFLRLFLSAARASRSSLT